MPTIVALGGTSLTTTELAPILASFPTLIGPNNFAPAPIITPSPILGCPLIYFEVVAPKVT